MKKVFMIIASLVIIASAFSGCGAKESSTAETTATATTAAQTTAPATTAPTTQPNSTEPNDHAVMEETFPEYTGSTSSEEETFYQGAVLEETFPPYTGPDVPMEELMQEMTAVLPEE